MTRMRWAQHRETLQRMADEGHSQGDIGRFFGVKPYVVGLAMRRMGIFLKQEDIRRRRVERIMRIHNDPVFHAQHAEAVRRANRSEKKRKTHAEQMRKYWREPEYRERMSEIMRNNWQNPELSARYRLGYERAGAATKAKFEFERSLLTMSKFERQLTLVRLGRAKIVEARLFKPAHDFGFTVGGVSSYGR